MRADQARSKIDTLSFQNRGRTTFRTLSRASSLGGVDPRWHVPSEHPFASLQVKQTQQIVTKC